MNFQVPPNYFTKKKWHKISNILVKGIVRMKMSFFRSIQWRLRSLVKNGPQNPECNPKETFLEFSGTSNSCLFPDAFIRIVAIRSAKTVRVDCNASWSAASASSDSETSSCANDVWSSVISSCNIRISSIKAYLEMKQIKWLFHSTERRRYLRMRIFYIKDKLSKGAWGIQHSTICHCWISLLISNFKQITRRNFCKYYTCKFALSANFLKGIQVDTVKIMNEWVIEKHTSMSWFPGRNLLTGQITFKNIHKHSEINSMIFLPLFLA